MGARLNWIMHYGLPPRFAKNVRVIQLDIAPEAIGNNVPTEVPLVGDGKAVMTQINKALERRQWFYPADTAWRAAIAQKSADKKFHVRSGGKEVTLDLIKIHDDQRSHLGGNKYFACVDMKAANGAIYDIDFFIAIHPGVLSVTGTSVHKINGKPLYNWKEENGVWKKAPVP